MGNQRYTFEQREAWCKAYLRHERVETPEGVRRPTFIRELRDWARKYRRFGPDSINPAVRRRYSQAEVLAAASLVASGEISAKEAARIFGIKDKRTVRAWARKYREGGPDALKSRHRRDPNAEERIGAGAQGEDQRLRAEAREIRAGERLSKKLESLGRATGGEPRRGEKAQAVRQTREEFPEAKLRDLLAIAGLGKSTYLYCVKHPDPDAKNAGVIGRIKAIFGGSEGRYGVRRVAAVLRSEGAAISNRKVNRLMRKLGLRPYCPRKKYRSYKGGEGRQPQRLLVEYVRSDGTVHHKSDFTCLRPDEKWSTDATQFDFPWGKCYLSPIKDMFTGEIISWDLSVSPNMAQIDRMLRRAFRAHPWLEGLIFHSDQGWQYMSKRYARKLAAKGILQSMSRKGNCYDNGIMESFFGRMKVEMYYGREGDFASFGDFRKAVEEYIDWYNRDRIREACGYKAPIAFRSEWAEANEARAARV
jgi:putative transposase